MRVGDVIAGKYRVDGVLGSGGMGVVLAAHHLQLGEKVALKVLAAEALGSLDAVARFMREARTTVRIKSDHVARVADVGQLETGSPYIVMEHLDGCDLSAWLQLQGPLPVPKAIDFVLQACEAIAEAHVLGIVHRDLKPANLFCVQRPDGELWIKVLDFGISKITTFGDTGYMMTSTGALIGSPSYMSPEQIRAAKTVDERTDIWALGMTLFELLTGHAPFEAEAVPDLAIKVTTEPPTPLSTFRPDAPEALERVILCCLEKDRAARFQTVGELAVALQPFAPDRARLSVERVLGTLRKRSPTTAGSQPDVASLSADPATMATMPADLQQTADALMPTMRADSQRTAEAFMPTVRADPLEAAAAWQTAAKNSRRRTTTVVWVAGGLLIGVAALGAFLHRGRAVASAPPSATPIASAAPVPAEAISPLPVAPASAEALPAPAVSASAVAPKRARPPRASGGVAAPECNPGYTLDANGDKHFKPECFLK
jgi:serine/threonine protein kinase